MKELIEEVFGGNVDKALAYHDLLATVANERGFIGPREVPRLWDRHLLNCAVVAEAFPEASRILDIGSGAGLPGIPLALACPEQSFVLLEPLLKRSVFLDEVVQKLALDNVEVVRGRAEEGPIRRSLGTFDVVTSRAVAPLGKLAQWSLPFVRNGGQMVAMKGASVEEEITRDADIIRRAGGQKPRVLVVGAQLAEPTTVVSIPK